MQRCMEPLEGENICLVSYAITSILLNGTPKNRTSFWKAYYQELALNENTEYDNYHVRICREKLDWIKPGSQLPLRNGTIPEIQLHTQDAP